MSKWQKVRPLGSICLAALLSLAAGCDPCMNNPCDDGLFCNGVEMCTAGADGSSFTCEDGAAVMCDGELVCDEMQEACIDLCEGMDCDDSNLCTEDACVNGECVNVEPTCDDGDACTIEHACVPDDGTCVGRLIDCGPAKQCLNGLCIGAECIMDSDCDDSLNCTIDACDTMMQCVSLPVVCPTGQVCDVLTGDCITSTCDTDADCPDDGLFCNGTESCDMTVGLCASSGDPCVEENPTIDPCVFTIPQFCVEQEGLCMSQNIVFEPGTSVGQLTTSNDTLKGCDNSNTLFDAQLFLTSGGNFVQTIGSGDSLDGGTGNNTLSMQTNSATTIKPVLLKNIQTITIQSVGAPANLDVTNADSIETINCNNCTNDTTVTNVQTVPATVGSINTAATSLSVTLTNAALTGGMDALTYNVSGVTGGTHTFQPTTGVRSGYETMTVNSSGNNANVLTNLSQGNGNTLSTVNVTGDQSLTITNELASTVVIVDASGTTGKLSVGVGNNITSITGGSSDDTFTFAGTNYVSTSDTVDGGANTTAAPGDTLVAQSGQLTGTAAAVSLATGIETIGVSNALAGNLNITHFGAANVNLAGTDGTARTVTMASGGVVKLSANTGNSVTFAASPNTNTDALTVELSANFAAGDNLVATTFENLTIEAKTAARTINGTTALANSANAEAITVLGSQNLTFIGAITADSVNGSAMTGTAILTITAAMNGASVITGGPGNDVLTESTGNDIVNGGGGNDTISIRAGNDSITGGTGNDSIVFIDAVNDTANDAGSNTLADFSFGATSDTLTFDVSGLGTLGGGAANPVAAANYFEGAITGMTAGTAYSVIVITNVGYASANAFETALAAQSTSITDALVVFFNTTTSRAELYVDSNIAANGPEIAAADLIVTFSNITTLAGMTQFANTDFIFGA